MSKMLLDVIMALKFPIVSRFPFFLVVHLPGSCWAIAVTDAIAAAHAILSSSILNSSTQAPFIDYTQLLLSASSNPNNMCGGGSPWNAFRVLSDASPTGGLKANVSEIFSTNVVRYSILLMTEGTSFYAQSNRALELFQRNFFLLPRCFPFSSHHISPLLSFSFVSMSILLSPLSPLSPLLFSPLHSSPLLFSPLLNSPLLQYPLVSRSSPPPSVLTPLPYLLSNVSSLLYSFSTTI